MRDGMEKGALFYISKALKARLRQERQTPRLHCKAGCRAVRKTFACTP